MVSSTSSDYVIYHPEKLRLSDIFTTLVFGTSLVGSELIETSISSNVYGTKVGNVGVNLITVITWILQRIMIWISGPLALFGLLVEFTLNLFSLNGGLLRLLHNLVTGSLVIPKKESADYRSILAHIDERTDLYRTSSVLNHLMKAEPMDNVSERNPLDLCMMAAKIVYENKAYIENVITNHWKMYFVEHYNFWNEYLKSDDTQAFICCDRKENAQLIIVAFRGTEPFSGKDWATDLDLSWMSMGEMGRAHVGFMKALGLQDEKDYQKGWPKNYAGSRKLAYYTIRSTLKTLLQQNRNARIIVTGHSLGGALAILFPSILVLHQEEDIMTSLLGVYTFGQPRVGDKDFGDYMKAKLNVIFKRYYRVVYRYDVVPRVPFDDPISKFVHFGGCVYYRSWYKGEMMKQEPNKNYFNILYIPSKYLNAWLDLFRAVFARIRPGKEFKESWISISFRLIGLLIPGMASHSPRDYVNGARLARVTIKDEEASYTPRDDDYVNGALLAKLTSKDEEVINEEYISVF
ncbi:hypothetical protein AQUCO_02600342v1 [Aquilegia coerulea]|uniref:Fungal lipase-type domain-containing protein n=1 Tax=Aquilegia coerulea TaxID=218851 RepID=A0A2G5D8I0_AQUCA|nr:hypothetical protein AQUCO_02600342v1 [Aquilegia coerulea]